uniref:Uncharacterized protein n=1 Tax=Romanomermis culicivorax TaxID=13658 RepID=A0A915KKB4_ROMCU
MPSAAPIDIIQSACPLSSCVPCAPALEQKKVSNRKITTSNQAPRIIVIQQPIVYYLNVSNNVDRATREMGCQADFANSNLGASQSTQTLNNEVFQLSV